jgi:hypothetical protein
MTSTQVTRLPVGAICAIALASMPALVLDIELRRENPNEFLAAILVVLIVLPLLCVSNREGKARGSAERSTPYAD